MSSETRGSGPLEPAVVAAPVYKKSWREKRWERRHRRRAVEEALGWILVPIILICAQRDCGAMFRSASRTPTPCASA